jgi:hypothetical protein
MYNRMPDFTKEQHEYFSRCDWNLLNNNYLQILSGSIQENIDSLLWKQRVCNRKWVTLIRDTYKNDKKFDFDLYFEWVDKGYGNETFFKYFNEKEIEYCYNNQYDDDKPWLPSIDRIYEEGDLVYKIFCYNTLNLDGENVTYLCRCFESEVEF